MSRILSAIKDIKDLLIQVDAVIASFRRLIIPRLGPDF